MTESSQRNVITRKDVATDVARVSVPVCVGGVTVSVTVAVTSGGVVTVVLVTVTAGGVTVSVSLTVTCGREVSVLEPRCQPRTLLDSERQT